MNETGIHTEQSDKIVVAEYDLNLAHLISRNLEYEGFQVQVCLSGAEAISWVQDNPVTLLLLDYTLPDMTGRQVIETLNNKQHWIPFIIITNRGDEINAAEMMKFGAVDYLFKDAGFLELLPFIVKKAVNQLKAERELKEKKEVFKKSERELNLVLYNMLEIVAQLDKEGTFQYVSPSYKTVLGYEPEDLLGKSSFSFVHQDDLDGVKLFMGTIMGTESPEKGVFRFRHADGRYLWIESYGKTSYNNKEITGIINIGRDITERKQADLDSERLKDKQVEAEINKFADIVKNMQIGLHVYHLENPDDDSTLRIVFANGAAFRITGIPEEDVLGKTIDKVFPGIRKMNILQTFAGVARSGQPVNLEEVYYGDDRVLNSCFSIRAFPLSNSHVGVTFEDITWRKNTEKTLRESEEKFRLLYWSLSEGMALHEVLFDNNGNPCDYRFLDVNSSFERITGLKRDQIIGRTAIQVLPETEYHFIEEYGQVALTGKPKRFEKYLAELNKYIEVYAFCPKKCQFAVMLTDITERKKFEEQLKYLSLHDQMTGLYNRAYFEDELKRLEGGRDYPISIIVADLDGLKLINDTMGHSEGDRLLKACAGVLKTPLRKSDVLARIGGDEFALFLLNTDNTTGERIVKRIRYAQDKSNLEHPELPLSISLGLATAEKPEQSLLEAFKKADNIMNQDKLYRSAKAREQIVNSLLTTLSERDYIAEGHAERVKDLCHKIGDKMDLPPREVSDLSLLAHVHDLGKVGVPERILFKKTSLTTEEWEIIRQHPEKGYRIACSSPSLAVVANFILHHHEWWDGTGYPLGLKGRDIPLVCRILALVDAYDVMTNDRPYSRARTKEEAVAEIQRYTGKQFDPELVEKFLLILKGE